MSERSGREHLIDEVRRFVGFSPADEARVAGVRDAVRAATDTIVGRFYDTLTQHEGARRVFEDDAQIGRLKDSLARWLDDAFTGPWDHAYQQRRGRIGHVHVRIGLPQRYMVAAMNVVRRSVHKTVRDAHPAADAESQRTHDAIDRLLDLELALMLETYQLGREAEATRAYEEILRSTSDVVLTALPDGRVTQVNRNLPGLPRHRLLRAGINAMREVQTPESRERFDVAWATVTTGDRPVENVPLEHTAEDGRHIHCLMSLLPDLREAGRMRLVRGIIRDVTALRELERDLEERRRLASVGEMVAGVAHEVRNPLQAVMLGVRRAAQRLGDDPSAAEALQRSREGAETIERLVTDLLSFSRRLSLSLSTIEASALIESAVSNCETELAGHAPPVLNLPDAEIRFRADPFRMSQVLKNLIANAAEASGAEGIVTISAILDAPDHVDLRVSDNGPGLPDDVRERLFEPFVTTKAGGTGLGLAIARRLVEAHGGRIAFLDRQDGGTEVSVRLPLAGPPPS